MGAIIKVLIRACRFYILFSSCTIDSTGRKQNTLVHEICASLISCAL